MYILRGAREQPVSLAAGPPEQRSSALLQGRLIPAHSGKLAASPGPLRLLGGVAYRDGGSRPPKAERGPLGRADQVRVARPKVANGRERSRAGQTAKGRLLWS